MYIVHTLQGVPKKHTFRIIILQADTSKRSDSSVYTNPEFNAIHFSNGVLIRKLSLTVLWGSRILKIKNQTNIFVLAINRNEMKWLQKIFQEWKDSAESCSTQGQSCTSCKTALIQMWEIQILKHWQPISSLQYFEFWVLSDHYKTI